MSTLALVQAASPVTANTAAAANTLVLRDNQGGATHAAVTTGLLINSGAQTMALTAVKTSVYTVATPTGGTGGDRVVLCDPTGGAFAVNLPAAATLSGQTVTIKNASASTNSITITPNGVETIDGAATLVINSARGKSTLISDGSNWHVIG